MLRTFAYEGFEPVAALDGLEGAAVLECDQVGQPRLAVDREGALVWEGRFDAWGADLEVGPIEDGGLEVDARFPGQVADDESGLRYNRHRYYDSGTRTYTQTDPIKIHGGLNPHGYVAEPLAFVDVYGLSGGSGRIFTRGRWQAPSSGTGHDYTVYQRQIDWDQRFNVRGGGTESNLDRALRGAAPRVQDRNGRWDSVQLHHSRQQGRGPLFELNRTTHQAASGRGREALQPYGNRQNPVDPVDRKAFEIDRKQYWIDRDTAERARRGPVRISCKK